MILQNLLRISPKAAKAKNEMANIWQYSDREQNTRSSDASNNLMKFTWEITKAWFLYVRGKFFVKSENGKNPTKLEIIYGIKIKRREARQNWKEERKKINKEKDYGRLRSVNENESKVQKKKKNEKRRLTKEINEETR